MATDQAAPPGVAAPLAPRMIALLGFGEAGSVIARDLCAEGGWRDGAPARELIAIDTACEDGARGAAMRVEAERRGVPLSRDYTAALGTADLVISVVTGTEARAAATMARPWLRPGTLYADVNSITGPETRVVAAALAHGGVDFVDVAAMGVFKVTGIATPLLLSGPRAPALAAFVAAVGGRARVLNETVGDASAVKILRSVLMKGLEALSVECLVAARRQGLVSEVLDNLGDVDAMGFAAFVRALATTHLVHAKRRLEEMEKAQQNLAESGVPALMTGATQRSHRRTVDAALDPAAVTDLDLDAALRILDEIVGRPGG